MIAEVKGGDEFYDEDSFGEFPGVGADPWSGEDSTGTAPAGVDGGVTGGVNGVVNGGMNGGSNTGREPVSGSETDPLPTKGHRGEGGGGGTRQLQRVTSVPARPLVSFSDPRPIATIEDEEGFYEESQRTEDPDLFPSSAPETAPILSESLPSTPWSFRNNHHHHHHHHHPHHHHQKPHLNRAATSFDKSPLMGHVISPPNSRQSSQTPLNYQGAQPPLDSQQCPQTPSNSQNPQTHLTSQSLQKSHNPRNPQCQNPQQPSKEISKECNASLRRSPNWRHSRPFGSSPARGRRGRGGGAAFKRTSMQMPPPGAPSAGTPVGAPRVRQLSESNADLLVGVRRGWVWGRRK